jgi:hypothetical protein
MLMRTDPLHRPAQRHHAPDPRSAGRLGWVDSFWEDMSGKKVDPGGATTASTQTDWPARGPAQAQAQAQAQADRSRIAARYRPVGETT